MKLALLEDCQLQQIQCETNMPEVVTRVLAATGSKSKLTFQPLPADDPKQRSPKIDGARDKLDSAVRVSLDECLSETVAYFRSILK